MFTLLDHVSRVLRSDEQPVPKPRKQPKQSKKQHKSKPVDTRAAQQELSAARERAREIVLEAKDQAVRIRQEALEEIERKESQLNQRLDAIGQQESRAEQLRVQVETKLADVEKTRQKQLSALESVAQLSQDEARQQLLNQVQDRASRDIAHIIKQTEERARETADKKAREVLVDAIRFGAIDYVPEFTVSTVKLPDEEMKGRIIGKEGRNIRAFEQATGVDVDLDEEGVIRISSFDAVRREVARVALEKLLKDGRIQPVRIEEVVQQTQRNIERVMFEAGEDLCHRVNVYNLPRDLIALLGRFKYRSSYGQNMIAHTLEETKIGVALAHEVGADVNVVRLGCLLHDIGKVITDKEGSHVELGVELLKKHSIPQAVIDCVAQHHEDMPFTSVEAVLVYIADAVSGGRPGARYEDVQEYIKRLSDLEEIATAHKGAKEAYAIQAGRELRVIVKPDQVSDDQATVMAQRIKDAIQEKLTYPGNIRVTVVRETRAVEVAR